MLSFLDLHQGGDLRFEIVQKGGKELVLVLDLIVEHDLEGPWLRICCTEGDYVYKAIIGLLILFGVSSFSSSEKSTPPS